MTFAQVPAVTAHDDGATGPGQPRRPARRRDADTRDQEQQQQQQEPLLQQQPAMESVSAQLMEVAAAGASGAPQEIAGAAGAKKGGRGKVGKALVVEVGEGSYGEAWRLCCPRAGGSGGGGRGAGAAAGAWWPSWCPSRARRGDRRWVHRRPSLCTAQGSRLRGKIQRDSSLYMGNLLTHAKHCCCPAHFDGGRLSRYHLLVCLWASRHRKYVPLPCPCRSGLQRCCARRWCAVPSAALRTLCCSSTCRRGGRGAAGRGQGRRRSRASCRCCCWMRAMHLHCQTNATCGFVRTCAVAVCRGPYPKELVKEWER